MPEERRDASRANGTQITTTSEKLPPKMSSTARVVCGQHNSTPNHTDSLEAANETNLNRLCAGLKDQVVVSPKLQNGGVSINSTPEMEPPTVSSSTSSVSSVSSSSTPAKVASKTFVSNSTDSSPLPLDGEPQKSNSESCGQSEVSVEPNNNHIPVPPAENESLVSGRDEYRPTPTKEVSPAKNFADSRSKTATPQDQACYKSTRRACRIKSINGSPASYHTSLMGPAQPSMYAQTYPPTGHYYALYASSQSVPIACQRHDASLQQLAYRQHNSGAMNGDGREERLSTTNLFVRPLLETDTKETLIALVSSAVIGGDKAVKSARVTHDRKQHSYGFIDFYQEENARKALDFLSKDLTIRQCRPGLEVKYARDSEKDDKNVYLSGVPTDFTDKDQLLSIFQPYGAIDSVHIMTNSSGDPTGVAFVRFNTTEDAERAIEAVKNGDALINGKSVDAKFADRHSAEDKRRRRRQNMSTTALYQNGAAAGLTTPTGLVNGYGSMSSAHHALASASPQPHLNMVIPSYHIRYYPSASAPSPFLSSSAPSTAAALSGTPSHFLSLHPSAAAAAYQLGNASASQYPAAAAAAMLGASPSHNGAASQAAALSAAAALNAAYHPLSAAVAANGNGAASHQSFVSAHDQAALSAYQYYLNGASGYPVTESGTAGNGVAATSAPAAYFQPATAQ